MTLHRHPRRDSNSEAQKPPPPKRPLYTPKAKQARIIAASLAGKSQRQIAREVGADRETVSRVLSQSEVQAFLDAYRDQYRELVPLRSICCGTSSVSCRAGESTRILTL